MVQALLEENRGSSPSDPVLVVQAMGRRIGFIPAAARLADPDREQPIQIYLPEVDIQLPELAENVHDELLRSGRVLVILSEGFRVCDTRDQRDAFGHIQFGAGASSACQVVVNYLNQHGLPVRGKARGQIPGTDQRHSMLAASTVDLQEAYEVGERACQIAAEAGTGYMVTIARDDGPTYRVSYGKAPLRDMANAERRLPQDWIAESRIDVTDAFVRYAQPLIGEDCLHLPTQGGLLRFARLRPMFAPQLLGEYVPSGFRQMETHD
jgi:6-phosphofructokinase 1